MPNANPFGGDRPLLGILESLDSSDVVKLETFTNYTPHSSERFMPKSHTTSLDSPDYRKKKDI